MGLFQLTVFRSVHREESPDLEVGTHAEAMEEFLCFSLLSYGSSQDHQPRRHLPQTVVNQENGLQTCADMPDLWRHFPDEESVFPDDPTLCQINIKTSKHR